MGIEDYSTNPIDNKDIPPGDITISADPLRRDHQIIDAIRQIMADLASWVGGDASFEGIDFGSAVAASPSDLSRHIALWGATYGFSITSNQLNYNVNNNADHVWYHNSGVELMRLDSSALTLDIDQLGKIKFPATQLPSTDPNTFDDYEEGTWTPDVTFTTPGDLAVTWGTRVGRYIKIGKMVTIWFRLIPATFTHTTAAGEFRITGIPYAGVTASGLEQTGTVEHSLVTFDAGRTQLNAQIISGASHIRLVQSGSAVSRLATDIANHPTATIFTLIGCITYEAAS